MSSNDNTNLWLGVSAVALLGVGAYFLLKPEETKQTLEPVDGGGTSSPRFGDEKLGITAKPEAQAVTDAKVLGFVDGHKEMSKLLSDLKLMSPVTGAGYMQRYHVNSSASFAARAKAKQVNGEVPFVLDKYEEGFLRGAEAAMLNANYRSTLFQGVGTTVMQASPKVLIAYHPNGGSVFPPPGYEALSEEFIDPNARNIPNAVANSPYLHTLANRYVGLV